MAEEPESKRAKLNINFEKLTTELKNSTDNLRGVVSNEFDSPVIYVHIYVVSVQDKRNLSTLIKLLNEKLPLKELQHLKRVNKNHVILCTVEENKEKKIEDVLNICKPYLPNDAFDSIKEVEVPLHPPKSRKQFDEANRKWPCNFHPDKYLEKLLSNSFFECNELAEHRLLMSLALEAAQLYFEKKNKELNQDSLSNFNVGIVYDPVINSVVTISIDNRENHPIQHATMTAIDNVAKTQNEGSWHDDSSEIYNTLKQNHPNLNFKFRQYLSKEEATNKEQLEGPYLCTGYYIYLLREPCVMCSMGLVHARIKRVFFCYRNERQGALLSQEKLHCVQFLNHHFEVFTGFL